MSRFSHLDEQGRANMVDVSAKPATVREAVARAQLRMQPETLAQINDADARKGDVLAVARVAGIQAAKKTAELIPLCHTLPLDKASVTFSAEDDTTLRIEAHCITRANTGVEMEALTAASVAALTVYDMCKAVDRGMVIERVCLMEKSGGQSGDYRRDHD